MEWIFRSIYVGARFSTVVMKIYAYGEDKLLYH